MKAPLPASEGMGVLPSGSSRVCQGRSGSTCACTNCCASGEPLKSAKERLSRRSMFLQATTSAGVQSVVVHHRMGAQLASPEQMVVRVNAAGQSRRQVRSVEPQAW